MTTLRPHTSSALHVAVYAFSIVCVILLVVSVFRFLIRRCVHALDKDDQILVQRLTETATINGPGIFFTSPFVKGVTRRKAELLKPLDFMLVKDQLTGKLDVISGPKCART